MILRERQQEFVDKSIAALDRYDNTLSVAPTGFGKTIVLSSILGKLIEENKGVKACVLAHRDELTYQNQDKFLKINPEVTTSLVNADAKDWGGQVSFAMVQTLSREKNLESMPKLDVLVVDEAHHAPAKTYKSVINKAKELNPNLKLLGVTATPARGDRNGLGTVFSNCAMQIRLGDVIGDGHLVMPKTFIIDVGIQDKLKELHQKTKGDYDDEEVAAIMNVEPVNEAVVEHWKEKAGDRKTVIFCSTIAHAVTVNNTFNKVGINSALITGEVSKEYRAHVLDSMSRGELQVIVNVGVLTEGWDYPPISCVVLLRGNSFKSTMIQMVGRGLRIVDNREYPDIIKTDCIVLDFGISSIVHGTLEQDVDLSLKELPGKAPRGQLEDGDTFAEDYMTCPECSAKVPALEPECIFCGAILHKELDKTPIRVFEMREVDMLAKSKFAWGNIPFKNDGLLFTNGFEAWSCVFKDGDHYVAAGGRNKKGYEDEAAILYKGDKAIAINKGNDYLYDLESEMAARKSASWRDYEPSEQQMSLINDYLKKYSHLELNKGAASNVIAFEFSAKKQLKELGYRI